MNNHNPIVSVIIPTYKRTVFYLSRAVRSVLNQTYRPIEIIVIDDSPSDYPEREEIHIYMEQMMAEYPYVHYLQNEKSMGGSCARNRGIEACIGEYVTFLDDDDEYRPEKVEKQLRFMQVQQCEMSFSNMIMYDTAGHVVDFRSHTDIPAFDNETLLHHHLTKKLTGTPTFMYVASRLREIGGFDDAKHGQEFYLMLKTIECGLKIRYFNDCDVIVYKHPDGGISQGKNKITGEIDVYNRIREYFPRLTPKERRYACFRHWAVMAVAYKRNKMYLHVIGAGIRAVVVSPLDFLKEIRNYLKSVILCRIASCTCFVMVL